MSSSSYANLPLGQPPPGIISNFDHAPSRAIEAHIGMGICIGITLVFVLLRFYVKLAITQKWGWDDCTCLLGFGLILAHDIVAFTIMGPGKWLGTHIWDIRFASLTKSYLQNTLASINLYAAAAFFVKLSLFFLYFRLFKPNKVTRWLIYGGIFVCGLFYSISIIINCAVLIPRPNQPDTFESWLLRAQKEGFITTRLAVAQGIFGTISDIYLLVIPIQSVFQLQLSTNRKLGVSAIFLIGIIAIVCSVGSLSYRVKSLYIFDTTWFGTSIYIFSSAEVSAGIICSCMPILAALFRERSVQKSAFLRYLFSVFTVHSSRKPIIVMDQNGSSDDLHPVQPKNHKEGRVDEYVKMKSGTGFMQLNDSM